jgi:hypothetical protein
MKHTLIAAIITFLAAGCQSGSANKTEETASAAGEKSIPYFDFDEVIHYRTDQENSIADTLNANAHNSPGDSVKKNVLAGHTPAALTDTAYIDALEKMGYRKKRIDPESFNAISAIFSQQPNVGSVKAGCPAFIYQHILIFRKAGQISGMAKINFRCTQQQIVGTKLKTDYFGQNGDYEKLEELLEK